MKQSFIKGPHLIVYAFLAFIAFALGASAAAFFIAFFAMLLVCCWTCKGKCAKVSLKTNFLEPDQTFSMDASTATNAMA